jgi:hypothetical protein
MYEGTCPRFGMTTVDRTTRKKECRLAVQMEYAEKDCEHRAEKGCEVPQPSPERSEDLEMRP